MFAERNLKGCQDSVARKHRSRRNPQRQDRGGQGMAEYYDRNDASTDQRSPNCKRRFLADGERRPNGERQSDPYGRPDDVRSSTQRLEKSSADRGNIPDADSQNPK